MIEKPPPSSYSWYPFRAFGTTSFASFLRARHDLVRVKPVTASVGVGCFGGSERKKKGRKFLGLDMGSWNMTTTQTIDVYREIPQNYLSQHFSIKFDPSKASPLWKFIIDPASLPTGTLIGSSSPMTCWRLKWLRPTEHMSVFSDSLHFQSATAK